MRAVHTIGDASFLSVVGRLRGVASVYAPRVEQYVAYLAGPWRRTSKRYWRCVAVGGVMASWGAVACRVAVLFCIGGCASSSPDAVRTALSGGALPTGDGFRRIEPHSAPPSRLAPASRFATELTAAATPGSQSYKVGPQDVLEIAVFKVPELSRNVQVSESGTINLALVGDVTAAGRTAQEIERDLVGRLGAEYLQKPQVTVFVKEYNSQRITIEGAVKKPGVFPYRGRSTLLQAIALAEGLDAVSDNTVVVFRTINGRQAAAKFDIARVRSGSIQDPPILSGDVVVVATSAVKETFNTILKALPLAGVFALL